MPAKVDINPPREGAAEGHCLEHHTHQPPLCVLKGTLRLAKGVMLCVAALATPIGIKSWWWGHKLWLVEVTAIQAEAVSSVLLAAARGPGREGGPGSGVPLW